MTTRQTKRRPGAPAGNGNRRLPAGAQPKRGKALKFSMPYEEWQEFCAACDLSEGHALSEEEYEEVWRTVDRAARRAFIEANQGLVDPEVLIV